MSKSEDPVVESMNVVRTATTDTLTRKSKLTYQIGTLPDGEVYVRIYKNSGNGFFSNEWVSLQDIQKTIGGMPAGKPVTAIVLSDLFEGRSVNTPGFMLSALVEETLLVPMQGRKRSHEPVSPEEFRERIQPMVSGMGKPRMKATRSSPAAKKKAQLKKKSVASRKKKARTVRGS
jgi:hypothetical protein